MPVRLHLQPWEIMRLRDHNPNNIVRLRRLLPLIALGALLLACNAEEQDSATPQGKITPQDSVAPQGKITPKEAVNALVFAAPHGLSARSGLAPTYEETLRKEPASAARAVGDLIDFEEMLVQVHGGDRDRQKQLERAISLLGAYPSADGDDLLGSWYLLLFDQRLAAPQAIVAFDRLSFQILDALGERYLPAVARKIETGWDGMDVNERQWSLSFLAKSGKGVPEAITIVRALRVRDGSDATLLDRALVHMEE